MSSRRGTSRAWWAGLMAVGLLLAGCAPTGGSDQQQAGDPGTDAGDGAALLTNGLVGVDEPDGEPATGGTLTFATYSEARSLDPATTISSGSSGGIQMAAVYDVLLRYDPASGTYEPRLAKSFEPNEDATVWTLRLRRGVTFSDGAPLDADAVVGSIERYLAEGGPQAYLWQSSVASMEATGDYTVRFELTRPWPGFGYLLATGPGMIVAPAAYEGKGFTPIGAGPFVPASYAPGEERVLTAREDYWRGEPRLDRIRFVHLTGGQARLDLLQNEGTDVAYFRDPETVVDARKAGYGGYMQVLSLGDALLLNHREGAATSDVRVRKAIAYAIDVQTVNKRVNSGAGVPQAGLVPDIWEWPLTTEPRTQDLRKARKLVQAAKADGYDGTLTFTGVAQVSQKMAVTLEAMLERVGFQVKLDYAASITDLVTQVIVKKEFEVAIWSFGMSQGGVYAELYPSFHSGSPANLGGYADPQMDRLLEQLGAARDEASRRQVLARIQQRWKETVPAVTLHATADFIAWDDDVHGVTPTVDTVVLLDDAWVEK